MILLAVDPGLTTGMAIHNPGCAPSVLTSHEFPMDEFLDIAEQWIKLTPAGELVVVCEKFTINAGTQRKVRGERLWSVEQIGVLRRECSKAGQTFVEQTVTDAKDFATDDKLRRLGWYTPTRGGHANDACRHALLWLANQRDMAVLREL